MKMKLRIGTKLIGGFMVLVVLMLVISLVAYLNLQTVAKSADVILNDEVPIADASMEAMIAVISARDVMGEYLLESASSGFLADQSYIYDHAAKFLPEFPLVVCYPGHL